MATPKVTSVKVVKNDFGEYQVKAFVNGKRYERADYFTNDKTDAQQTAKLMVAEAKGV